MINLKTNLTMWPLRWLNFNLKAALEKNIQDRYVLGEWYKDEYEMDNITSVESHCVPVWDVWLQR